MEAMSAADSALRGEYMASYDPLGQLIPTPARAISMADSDTHLDAPRRRALYRAGHRGTKEMDWLLGRFAEAELGSMNDEELKSFEEFLALPDPDIESWLLTPGTLAPDGLAADFVARLKQFHDL